MRFINKRSIRYLLSGMLVCVMAISPVKAVADVAADGSTETVKMEATGEYPVAPEIVAESGIVIDIDTGAIIYEKDPHRKLYPASITKIMTALLAIENTPLDSTFTFTQDILNAVPWDAAKYGYVAGEEVNVKDLLHTLMLRSANEVATGLGIKVSGSEEEFGKLMTSKAHEIGAVDTNFTNASGLHDDDHYTTAYDMALITLEAMKNPVFVQVWSKENFELSPTNVNANLVKITNRHEMMLSNKGTYYQYAKGGKTGYTDEAGRTLVTYASKEGRNLLCVIMKSRPDVAYNDTKLLFEYSFNSFTKVAVNESETRFGQSVDSYFVTHKNMFADTPSFISIGNDYVTIPKDGNLSQVGYELSYIDNSETNKIADIKYFIGEHYLGKTSLYLNIEENDMNDELSSFRQDNEIPDPKEAVTINIWWAAAIMGGIVVCIIVIRIMVRTKGKRKAKRARRKKFKRR